MVTWAHWLIKPAMNRDFSLIDANFARVYEGLRVLEDSARFGLRDSTLSSVAKELRHRLPELEADFGPAGMVRARRGVDVGSGRMTGPALERPSLWSIIRANSRRVAEALRVLEEFGKLYAPGAVFRLEDIRYRVYTLEYQLLARTPHYWLRKYFERGIVYPLSANVADLIWFIEQGARVVQLRDKTSSPAEVFDKARKLCAYIQEQSARAPRVHEPPVFILNDYPDIAARLPVAGVHIGQDMNVAAARRLVGSAKIIGRSNQSLDQLLASQRDGADYASLGPVFRTAAKAEREPVGLEAVLEAVPAVTIPLVAIGGIAPENIHLVKDAGAKNVAVIGRARDFFRTAYENTALTPAG
ncbi:MAG: Thiamine-phosphate pyrophosphorylase [Candidatus Magasanikbacteria bacterium GW2011_GWA2_56_11]|uniref:Thiamine-phosphate pyrophosphorylase n=1 Tax=Candidatus Magasanikbacteria bacterium GW2011_GWA2_56_11 TaxID=1619044 RepID=A0A0G2B8H2_9BACT|nr:MAG: Thiamine-phosphate pyrophosphorylase [Candidatus Magasanikbacteria bacterium GW2011_GWA2_56_11]